ncbi:MAG: MBL fold metallo-hydrolase [Oscillospiraceae bacterium]|nr:MBL fold metallo-hydrolase [Oscillospiraceae bacterium]
MKLINDYIKYIPASNDPLSADVFFIEGDKCTYIFDVGNNEQSLAEISKIDKDKVIILSHFHRDHIGNIEKLSYKELYLGSTTYEKVGQGSVVRDSVTINDGVRIDIMHCPSPHAKGSLIATVNNEYTFIGDLYYTKPDFDKNLAHMMLLALEKIDTKYFVISHEPKDNIIEKQGLLYKLIEYFK